MVNYHPFFYIFELNVISQDIIINIMIEKVQISDLELSEIYAKGKGIDPLTCKLDEIINSGMHVGLVIQEE